VIQCFATVYVLPKDVRSPGFYSSGIPRQRNLPAARSTRAGIARGMSERVPGKYSESAREDQHAESFKISNGQYFRSDKLFRRHDGLAGLAFIGRALQDPRAGKNDPEGTAPTKKAAREER